MTASWAVYIRNSIVSGGFIEIGTLHEAALRYIALLFYNYSIDFYVDYILTNIATNNGNGIFKLSMKSKIDIHYRLGNEHFYLRRISSLNSIPYYVLSLLYLSLSSLIIFANLSAA